MFVSSGDFSLATGLGGVVLFQLESSLFSPSATTTGNLQQQLEKLLQNPRKDLSLFYGEAGDLWLLKQYLRHWPCSEKEIQLAVRYEKFKARARAHLTAPGRFELIRGAIGMGVLGRAMDDSEFLKEILTYLEGQAPEFFRLVDTGEVSSPTGALSAMTDLGFAHGISGILAFLVSYQGGPEEERAMALTENIFNTLSFHSEQKELLPKYIPEGESSWHQGWCYGNLSTAYALKLSGAIWELKHPLLLADTLMQSGLRYLENMERQMPEHLCHGSASFNLLCELMGSDMRFPISQKRDDGEVKNWALLNGEIGVRLSLLRSGRPSRSNWEELFLLQKVG